MTSQRDDHGSSDRHGIGANKANNGKPMLFSSSRLDESIVVRCQVGQNVRGSRLRRDSLATMAVGAGLDLDGNGGGVALLVIAAGASRRWVVLASS
jgi:hypothetical protein